MSEAATITNNVGYFGIADTSTKPATLICIRVEDRTKETLLALITRHIKRGSKIHSDCWRAYNDIAILSGYGYQHMTVNHSENFVDPVTGAHTQNIKSGWNQVKFDIKAGNGMSRDHLEDYLHEAMWRNRLIVH